MLDTPVHRTDTGASAFPAPVAAGAGAAGYASTSPTAAGSGGGAIGCVVLPAAAVQSNV